MNKRSNLQSVGIVAMTLSLMASSLRPAMAQPAHAQQGNHIDRIIERNQERSQEIRAKVEQKQQQVEARLEQVAERAASRSAELQLRREVRAEAVQQRLDEVKLRVCQNRVDTIDRIMDKTIDRSTALADKMNGIAEKVIEFKVTKGVEVEGYEDLVAELEAERVTVLEVIENAELTAEEFDCESDGPKAQLSDFVDVTDEIKAALRQYRDSIHEFILAVRQANGQNRTNGPEESTSSADETSPSAEEGE